MRRRARGSSGGWHKADRDHSKQSNKIATLHHVFPLSA